MDPTLATSNAPAAYGAWASLAVVLALAFAVVGGALLTVRLITRALDRIRDPDRRLTTYECGEAPVGPAWFRFNNRFIPVALTFLIFDVELALLWPILPRCLALVGKPGAWLAFTEIVAFAGILALGLVWVARMGGFAWDRRVGGDPRG